MTANILEKYWVLFRRYPEPIEGEEVVIASLGYCHMTALANAYGELRIAGYNPDEWESACMGIGPFDPLKFNTEN